MKKISLKNILPACLLALSCIVFTVVTGYALFLKERVEGQIPVLPESSEVTRSAALRTASPQMSSPAPTVEPIPAVDATDEQIVSSPFWSDGILFENDTYRSPTMSVTVKMIRDSEMFHKNLIYYVADVHVSDVTQIRTASASGSFKRIGFDSMENTCKRENALVAISGDFCPGFLIRNGEVYRRSIKHNDICLLLKTGEMVIMKGKETSVKRIMDKDPWQTWDFGPALIDADGNPVRSFLPGEISGGNPRSCIGYYEPGHYCFVIVDGRQKQSAGVTLRELALLMHSLGCTQAYNLDGGATAHFFYHGKVRNSPSGGGRKVGDIVYVAFEPYGESRFYCGKAGLSK